jgi:hypothetical protein
MIRKALKASGLALAIALAATTSASAGIGNACEVKETKDGFVAVRAAPNPKGALVSKATPGQIVEVVVDAKQNPVARGKWWRVRHYPGEAMPLPGEPEFKDIKEGWMHSALIDGCG